MSLITKEASATVSVIDKQPILVNQYVKKKKEINTSIDGIEIPASLLLRHKDDSNFYTLFSKQIEELYDVPQTPATSSGNLCGVYIAGKKQFIVQRNNYSIMNWDQYGLHVSLCEVELLPSTDTAEISVTALVGGQFRFPKTLRLEMQHCVYLTSEDQIQYLKFAIAPIKTTNLPYVFKTVEGGQFAVGSWNGSITRSKYCLVCIVGINGDQLESEDEEEKQEEEEEEGPPPPLSPSSRKRQEHDPSIAGGVIQPHSEGVGLAQPLPKKSQPEESTTLIQSMIFSSVNSSTVTRQIESERNEDTHPSFHFTKTPSSTDSRLEKAMTYAGLVYYEEEGKEVLVTFTAAKYLNALLQFIEKKHCNAKIGQNEYFRLKNPNGFIELKFDAPQDQSYNGWTIRPHKKPARLKQSDIDLFGDDYPIPAACLISVHESSDAVDSLHYGVHLEGVVDPVTLYIHVQLSTEKGTAIESSASAHSSLSQPNAEPNSSEIFKEYFFKLTDNLEKSSVFRRVVDNFFSTNLITYGLYSDVTSNSNDTLYDKSSKVASELYRLLKTGQNPKNTLSIICNVLSKQDDLQLKEIGDNMMQAMMA